jgi:hypothetical protein
VTFHLGRFCPTPRKAISQEKLDVCASLLAHEHWSVVTAFYPAVIAAVNAVFVAMVAARRRLLNGFD